MTTGLSRERQRELGVLKSQCARAAEKDHPTLLLTIHCSADTIDWIGRIGGEVFRDYTAAERRKMAQRGHAMPDGSWPIANCTDASNAIRSIGRAKDRSAVESHIRRRVRALGCTGSIFDNWK